MKHRATKNWKKQRLAKGYRTKAFKYYNILMKLERIAA